MQTKKVIISIDPGYERLGLAVLERSGDGTIHVLWSECFRTVPADAFSERLFLVGRHVEGLIEKYSPTACVMESIFMQNNQKTVMKVSEVRGALMYVAKVRGLAIYDLTPLQIKSAVAGTGRGDKAAVQKMVKMLLPELKKETGKIDDEYDAIACGLAYFALEKSL